MTHVDVVVAGQPVRTERMAVTAVVAAVAVAAAGVTVAAAGAPVAAVEVVAVEVVAVGATSTFQSADWLLTHLSKGRSRA